MSKKPTPANDQPSDSGLGADGGNESRVRDVAEKGVEQARKAVGLLLDAARSTSEAIQDGTKTSDRPEAQAVQRGFGYAKENIGAIFDFAQQLVRAPSLKGAIDMQAEFVRKQTAVMTKQVEELRGLSGEKTGDAGKDKPSGERA